ncbi:hypothetical protein KL925_004577 [Ogataea polymorpha]|nr:hypothetical protein KL936_004386 [Ogataea polymorpha]KAG7914346.1 hypothetical protein KL927_004540 [Ogataea polymorpha]KAG7925100.1 hypothetical protein KL925_004577 [Ogataea polymorpha]
MSECTKFCPAYVSILLLPLILEQKHLRAALLALQQKRLRDVQCKDRGDVDGAQRPENQRDEKKRSFCATVAFRKRLGKRRVGAETERQDPQSSTAAARVTRSVAGNAKKLHGAHIERGPSAETHNEPPSASFGTDIDYITRRSLGFRVEHIGVDHESTENTAEHNVIAPANAVHGDGVAERRN